MDGSQHWALILAAGKSERFGGIKALAPWGDGNLLSNSISLARHSVGKNICVVLGGHHKALLPFLKNITWSENPNWQMGMGTSIAWGVKKIIEMDPSARGILIIPVDQPLISIQHVQSLIYKSLHTEQSILTESSDKVLGPPALIHPRHFSLALDLQGDKGLKSVLSSDDFDVVVDDQALKDIDTPEDLIKVEKQQSSSVFIASYATKLALVETVLGSVVHGFNIPFGGNLLSLNQGIFLSRATCHFSYDRRVASFVPLQVSSVSAVLKSLSPAGQKLGPMIAISMQGFLYSIAILFLGPSRLAQSIGMVLLSLWAFVQPILMLWIFYGESLSKAGLFFYDRLKQTIPGFADIFIFIFIGLVFTKALVAALLPWVLSYFGVERFDRFTDRASEKALKYMPGKNRPLAKNQWQAFKHTFKDLIRPTFLIPCLLVTFFLVFSETKNAEWVWKMLRPFAVATVFFYLTNTPWMYRLSSYLRSRGYFSRFFSVLDQTRENLLKKKSETSVAIRKESLF